MPNTEPICECLPALREVTAQREERYRSNPDAAAPSGPQSTVQVKVTSIGKLNEEAESLKSGITWTISEPSHVGGLADAPTPLEYLLSGALGCFAAVFAFYAAKYEVNYDTFQIIGRAELDVRGHMIEDAPPSGFSSVDVGIVIGGCNDRAALDRVLASAIRGCPGITTLREPVEMRFELAME